MNKSRLQSVIWFLLVAAISTFAQRPALLGLDLPGQRADGSVLLPNQWSLRPVGQQVELGDFPVNIAVHPGGRFAAVLHCGYAQHEIRIVDLKQTAVVSQTDLHEAFYGLEFSRDGSRLYCSGASDEVIHVFDFKEGGLTENHEIRLRDPRWRGIPGGLAVSRDGRKLYAANVWGQRVSEVDLLTLTNLADIFFAPDAASAADKSSTFEPIDPPDPNPAGPSQGAAAQFDLSTSNAPFPYACRLDEKRQRLYVSLWSQACVAVLDLKSHAALARWPTGEHPNEMILSKSGRHLFVANANRNTVTILDTRSGSAVESLSASLSPADLPGSTPNSLALSPDETRLFVANACNNNVAVFDVGVVGKSRSLGFIPVAWYPTSLRVTPDGRQLLVANGKGLGSKANPKGPQPNKKQDSTTQLISKLFHGTLSIIPLPKGTELTKQLARYTAQAYQCTPQRSVAQVSPTPGNPVPSKVGDPSPIRYVIYIIKENRTYDQVLGDLPQGNGDPSLCLFPELVSPNHHKLARDFILLDNFYADAEVSPDGHEWSMGAYATDFVEKSWPMNYGHGKSKKITYPAEGRYPIATPANGYLWDRARQAGVSFRSYGEFVFFSKTPGHPGFARLPGLQDHFDPWYHGFDLNYSDFDRVDRFISEFKRFKSEGDMPRLQIVRLPNDHTSGTVPGKLTPTAYVAQNDRALGLIVAAVSHSQFWPQTAIFVVEDDAQNGPDHVDAHRTVAFVISPYTRRAAVDSTMYSTTSLLRTMELILGLQPMTQFDSAATPMFNAFQPAPDSTPYDALPANVDLNERNTRLAWGSKESLKMDFSKEDAADDFLLNEVIWRSVRGADHPMPAPIHAAYVFEHPKEGDDD